MRIEPKFTIPEGDPYTGERCEVVPVRVVSGGVQAAGVGPRLTGLD